MTDPLQERKSALDSSAGEGARTRLGGAFGFALPVGLRTFVRTREIGLTLAAIVIGLTSGLVVALISIGSQKMHELLFGLPAGLPLSLVGALPSWRILVVTTTGGAILAALGFWAGGRFRDRLADAIEANALQGGRLSFAGSLYITFQTVISNGFGASVGLEAAYTQICAAFASFLGRALAARRNDMRLLVACGAAGAIGAAFDAPLSGAFYAFETVLGAYSVISLVPVAASAVVSSFVAQRFVRHHLISATFSMGAVDLRSFTHILAIAVICSAASIALMTAVARTERGFDRLGAPQWLRPIAGGAIVGVIGMIAPRILGAGHGALDAIAIADMPMTMLETLLLLKCAGAAISLGSSFRGGLFFASLFIGGLVGRVYAGMVGAVSPSLVADPKAVSLLGMAAFGTGIVGAPVTMTCLALELTGNFNITIAALVASAITSLAVRETFGYSFATWRFHLRGQSIRGPHDIGWVRELEAGRLMSKDVRSMASNCTIAAARSLAPIDAGKEIMLVDELGRYVGIVPTADLHTTTRGEDEAVTTLANWTTTFLLPQTTIREALDLFERVEADALPVVDDPRTRRIVGWVSEVYALRRYGEELERRNRELFTR